jgi:hypothetical protein
MNARPEDYVSASNPLSGIGGNPNPANFRFGSITGTMTEGGGPQAAFDGNTHKPSWMSAAITRPGSSFDNYVAMNWAEYPGGSHPTGLDVPVIVHTLSSYKICAPVDSTFGSSSYVVQGSNVAGGFATWTTLASSGLVGIIGETVTGSVSPSGPYQFHRVGFWGGGGRSIAVAQVQFNVADTATMTTS